MESKANSRTVCRSFPFDFRFLIRLFSATIVRRNKDAPNAIRVPCNGTHEDVSTPCRIRQEINIIYSGGEYGMMPIYWCCCPHAVKAHEAIPAERSKPNGTKRKKKIVDINSNLWENFIDCYVVVFIFMPFDSMRFPHSAAPVAIYCNSIFSPFPSPAFCESRNTFFVFYRLNSAPLVRHSIRETDTRAKYFFFFCLSSDRTNVRSPTSFGFDPGRRLAGTKIIELKSRERTCTEWKPYALFFVLCRGRRRTAAQRKLMMFEIMASWFDSMAKMIYIWLNNIYKMVVALLFPLPFVCSTNASTVETDSVILFTIIASENPLICCVHAADLLFRCPF